MRVVTWNLQGRVGNADLYCFYAQEGRDDEPDGEPSFGWLTYVGF